MTVCPFDLTGPYVYDCNAQFLWIDEGGIADPQEPTDDEIATGVDLQADPYFLTDIIGWEIETEILRGADGGTWGPQEFQRLGEQTIAESRMVFAADRAGVDIRTLITRGDLGYIVILPSGPYLDHPTAPVNVYPVRVAQLTQRQAFRQPGSVILGNFAIRGPDRIGENVFIVESS